MVLKHKTDPKPRVPNRCYHGTHSDRIQITFDDHRLVANAGLALLVTLDPHLRLPQLVQQRLDLGYAPGRANTGDQLMTLVAANAGWLAIQVMAHNLARWTARIGLGEQVVTTKTLRRRFFSLAGRLTRSARRLTLHLPQRWPWENQFSDALARLRAIPIPS